MTTWRITICISLLLLSCEQNDKSDQEYDRSSSIIKIKYDLLEQVLINYYDECLSEHNAGVILINFTNNDDTLFTIYSSLSLDLQKRPPSYYTMVRKTPVLVYTGFEDYLQFDSTYLNNINKEIDPFLEHYVEDEEGNIIELPSNYNPVVWIITKVPDGVIVRKNM